MVCWYSRAGRTPRRACRAARRAARGAPRRELHAESRTRPHTAVSHTTRGPSHTPQPSHTRPRRGKRARTEGPAPRRRTPVISLNTNLPSTAVQHITTHTPCGAHEECKPRNAWTAGSGHARTHSTGTSQQETGAGGTHTLLGHQRHSSDDEAEQLKTWAWRWATLGGRARAVGAGVHRCKGRGEPVMRGAPASASAEPLLASCLKKDFY